ncbi:MAG: hypothetical protein ACTSRC_06215 [Candidatus Helarchaeota archaeon]
MRFSDKMNLGKNIAVLIGSSFLIAAMVVMFTSIIENSLTFSSSTIVLLMLGALGGILTGGVCLEQIPRHFKENTKQLRSKMNYCYSCGVSLEKSTTAEICPNCNSKLNLLDVIDI